MNVRVNACQYSCIYVTTITTYCRHANLCEICTLNFSELSQIKVLVSNIYSLQSKKRGSIKFVDSSVTVNTVLMKMSEVIAKPVTANLQLVTFAYQTS